MALVRTVLAALAIPPALLMAFLAFALDGYTDGGAQPAETTAFAIGWLMGTVVLIALVATAALRETKRESYSWLAVCLVALMAVCLAGFLDID